MPLNPATARRRVFQRAAKLLAARQRSVAELRERLEWFRKENRLIEEQRLEQRTRFDLEMMQEIGFTKGIENYSRHLSGAKAGDPPPTLVDYLPADALMFLDESHVLVGQLNANTQTRAQEFQAMLRSNESVDRVTQSEYLAYLKRPADTTGLAGWRGRQVTGRTVG